MRYYSIVVQYMMHVQYSSVDLLWLATSQEVIDVETEHYSYHTVLYLLHCNNGTNEKMT